STPSVRSAGVVGTLTTPIRPLVSSTRARSVNVPPISIPIRQAMPANPLWLPRSGLCDAEGSRRALGRVAPGPRAQQTGLLQRRADASDFLAAELDKRRPHHGTR